MIDSRRPLEGIKVLECAIYGVGPYAASLLGGLGADVLKVEPPTGDPQRRIPPQLDGTSSLYYYFNVYKRRVPLDLQSAAGQAMMRSLIEQADVLVANFRPGAIDRLGMSFDDVHRMNPQLVFCNCSAWGEAGPLAEMGGSDPYVQAYSGWTDANESGGVPELQRCLGHMDMNASHFTVAGILSALYARQRSGVGRKVDISMLECSLAIQGIEIAKRAAGQSATSTDQSSHIYECLDRRHLVIATNSATGKSRLDDIVRSATGGTITTAPSEDAAPLTSADLDARIRTRPSEYWYTTLLAEREIIAVFPWSWSSAQCDPQSQANQLFGSAAVSPQRSIVMTTPPWRFDAKGAPEPIVVSDADPQSVLSEWRAGSSSVASAARSSSAADELALSGLRVVEFSPSLSASFCGRLLEENGAELRRYHCPPESHGGIQQELCEVSDWYLNGEKRSVELLDHREDMRADVRLADVVLVGGGIERSMPDLGAQALARLNPKAVICVFSAYGEHGPLAEAPECEAAIQGLASIWGGLGQPDQPSRPTRVPQAQLTCGVIGYQAILAALLAGEDGPRLIHVNALAALLTIRGQYWTMADAPETWPGRHLATPYDPPHLGYRTNDRPVLFNINAKLYRHVDADRFAQLLADLGVDVPAGMDPNAPLGSSSDPRRPEWADFWQQTFSRWTAQEVSSAFHAGGGEAVPLLTWDGVLESEQVRTLYPERTAIDGQPTRIRCPWKLVTATGSQLTTRSSERTQDAAV